VIGDNFTLVEVETLPLDVIPDKYFYIDGEFIPNPNYTNQSDLEKRITAIEDTILEISMKVDQFADKATNI
jgi:hypothetical protein